jgi:hypothetical protein
MGLQTDLFVGSVQEAVAYDGAATNIERVQLGGLVFPVIESLVTMARLAAAQKRDLFVWTAIDGSHASGVLYRGVIQNTPEACAPNRKTKPS